jgi:hypothetical protein
MPDRMLQPAGSTAGQLHQLRQDQQQAQSQLLAAEAALAEEQAAVNAFRMHCRLKLDIWVDELLELQNERQSLVTRLALCRQAQEDGLPLDGDAPFWQKNEPESDSAEEELILPTDTPTDKAAERRLYRQLARRYHPDLGQTAVEIAYRTEMMAAVNNAYQVSDIQALYDLAGQLDPSKIAELATIQSAEVRNLRRQILNLQMRRRKAHQRLQALCQENTARLWRKARELDESGVDWWEIVRREIEQAIGRVREDIVSLQRQLAVPDDSPR